MGSQAFELLMLLTAMVFLMAGLALVLYQRLESRAAVARRVEYIAPWRRTSPRAKTSTARGLPLSRVLVKYSETPSRAEIEALRRLIAMGVPADRANSVYSALRLTLAAIFAAAMLVLAGTPGPNLAAWLRPMAMVLAGAVAGWYLPHLVVRSMARRREKLIEHGLPDALELLVICVEAGLALEDGLDHVVTELERSQPTLAEELAITAAELKILPDRDTALANLAKRVQAPSVRSVVTTLSQTMRYGTPLAQTLRSVASELRNDSLMALEEKANRLPVLLTIPMILFIMPSVFLIVGGPAVLQMIDSLFR